MNNITIIQLSHLERKLIKLEKLLYNYDLQETINIIKRENGFFQEELGDEQFYHDDDPVLDANTYWLVKDLEKLIR